MEVNNYNGALQHPAWSGFTVASTASEVINGINLSGKTAIVTGGYSGIGLETVRALVAAGAHVIVPAKNIGKAGRNLKGIANVLIESMDLMKPDSVEKFALAFLETGKPLHLLINNAGIMWSPLERDGRGYESQLATNYIGHFHLTALLWRALVMAKGARVVNVSSWGHHFSPFVFEDPNFQKRPYDSFAAYGQSKTAAILFALELDNRGKSFGVRSYSLHPGVISESDLSRNVPHEDLVNYGIFDEEGKVINDPSKGLKSLAQGASTTVWCATSHLLDNIGGVYCENADISEMDHADAESAEEGLDGTIMMKNVMPYALEERAAKRLWTLTEELAGVRFII